VIQDKLPETYFDLFVSPSNTLTKHIDLDPHIAIALPLERFMDMVLAVQNELKTQVLGAKRPRPVENFEHERVEKVPKPTHASTSTGRAGSSQDDLLLARKVGMCFGCGQLYPAGAVGTGERYNKFAHDQVCERPFVRGVITAEFRAAIVKWRELANSGKSLNAIAKIANSQRRRAE
jgi:hypothetical protein